MGGRERERDNWILQEKMEIREEDWGLGIWKRKKQMENVFMEENTPAQSRGLGLSETVGFAANKASSHHTLLLYTVDLVRALVSQFVILLFIYNGLSIFTLSLPLV